MFHFYIDIQIEFHNDIHQRVWLDDRLTHNDVFYIRLVKTW